MAIRSFNALSFCAGVGGLELGIRIAEPGARGVAYLEREAAAAASLVASMEAGWLHSAPVWSDVGTFDARPWRGVVHCIASGDPCQPNSVAGKRLGNADGRFLIDQLLRVIDECRPYRLFRENVPGNSNGQLEALVPALERMGYRVAGGIFSAEEVGASHRRERLFIMADAIGPVETGRLATGCEAEGWRAFGQSGGQGGTLADAARERPGEARQFQCGGPEERSPGCGGNVGDTAGARHGSGQSGEGREVRDGGGRPQPDRRSHAVDDSERAQRRPDGKSCDDEGPDDGQPGRREGPAWLGASGANVAEPDNADAQGRQRRDNPQGRQEPFGHAGLCGGTMVHAESVGRGEGRSQSELRSGWDAVTDASSFVRSMRLFAPGPTDPFWHQVCRDAAALEPAVCRVAHGLAGRIERLRAAGNGVCPLAAAYAWRSLDALHAEERAARSAALMEAA